MNVRAAIAVSFFLTAASCEVAFILSFGGFCLAIIGGQRAMQNTFATTAITITAAATTASTTTATTAATATRPIAAAKTVTHTDRQADRQAGRQADKACSHTNCSRVVLDRLPSSL